MAKCTFDGTNKLIIINENVTELDVKIDIYSDWKEWMVLGDNAKYLPAMSAIGGDPISETRVLGTTFFLENGWKLRPYEGNHSLVVSGNLYTRDGTSPFVPTLGSYNVVINMNTSTLVDGIVGIETKVWNTAASVLTGAGTVGKLVVDTERKVDDTAVIVLSTIQ